jgi:hypothetical protein
VIWPSQKLALKQPIFDSILPVSLQKIAYEKKIELGLPIGHIPDQTIKKRIFSNPRI